MRLLARVQRPRAESGGRGDPVSARPRAPTMHAKAAYVGQQFVRRGERACGACRYVYERVLASKRALATMLVNFVLERARKQDEHKDLGDYTDYFAPFWVKIFGIIPIALGWLFPQDAFVQLPEVEGTWMTDEAFAEQRLSGLCPVMIRALKADDPRKAVLDGAKGLPANVQDLCAKGAPPAVPAGALGLKALDLSVSAADLMRNGNTPSSCQACRQGFPVRLHGLDEYAERQARLEHSREHHWRPRRQGQAPPAAAHRVLLLVRRRGAPDAARHQARHR